MVSQNALMNVWGTMLSRCKASQSFYTSTRTRQSIYTVFFRHEGYRPSKVPHTVDQPPLLVSFTYIRLVSVFLVVTLVLLCSASWNDNVSISCFDELSLLMSISLRLISDFWHHYIPRCSTTSNCTVVRIKNQIYRIKKTMDNKYSPLICINAHKW
jgi:hypothetical protein